MKYFKHVETLCHKISLSSASAVKMVRILLNDTALTSHILFFQWPSCSAQIWKVPGSSPGRACRPSRSEFSLVFSETSENTGSLRKTPAEGTPPIGLGP